MAKGVIVLQAAQCSYAPGAPRNHSKKIQVTRLERLRFLGAPTWAYCELYPPQTMTRNHAMILCAIVVALVVDISVSASPPRPEDSQFQQMRYVQFAGFVRGGQRTRVSGLGVGGGGIRQHQFL